MSLELDVLRDVAAKLDQAGIDWMLTGSLAMMHYAQPRMTRNIDLVVSLTPAQAETIQRLFEAEYYVPQDTVRLAITRRLMFNLIHQASVIKVDLIVLKHTEFDQLRFARRQRIRFVACEVWIINREDLILSKLAWAKDSGSEMQIRDVRNLIATASAGDFDEVYLNEWIARLELTAIWQECLKP